jgi:hypothetical protein
VLAADDAKIGFPAARANGTPPTNLWLYHCGPQWAKRMLFSGDTISGLDAARIGLALEAYTADQIDDEADELARRISSVDAEILATHKRVVNMQMELAGAKTAQRYAIELARAHLSGAASQPVSRGHGRLGLKEALKRRDATGEGRTAARADGVGRAVGAARNANARRRCNMRRLICPLNQVVVAVAHVTSGPMRQRAARALFPPAHSSIFSLVPEMVRHSP